MWINDSLVIINVSQVRSLESVAYIFVQPCILLTRWLKPNYITGGESHDQIDMVCVIRMLIGVMAKNMGFGK
jgi:hypothetical protein